MYALGETKLRLDNAVGGSGVPLDADGKPQDQQTTNETKKSLMKAIRQKVVDTPGHATVKTEEDVSMSVDAA
jgi:ribosomal protein L39E